MDPGGPVYLSFSPILNSKEEKVNIAGILKGEVEILRCHMMVTYYKGSI